LAELAQLIDDVVIIANGRLRRAGPLAELYDATAGRVYVRGRDPWKLAKVFESAGARVTTDGETLIVEGLGAEEAGELAFTEGVPLHELTPDTPNLEQIFLDLTAA
jgi:ABC-2 type transport system ATP-binding protein